MNKPLFTNDEWNFELLDKTWDVINDIAVNRYGLDFYKSQIEIISSDQMIDAYCSHAMPIMYNHWSFGKRAQQLKEKYDHGVANLAYEVVINTDPCISYLMENNDMVMQTLVMAHAAVGHSSFFKTNYMFKEHTNAKSILDYLRFAKKYIAECELEYGVDRVETLIDRCHSIQYQSVDRYPRVRTTEDEIRRRGIARANNENEMYNHLYETINPKTKKYKDKRKERRWLKNELPEDNLLYFVEKHSLILDTWEREIVRIIRNISQYFYPQILTKTMNEGTASFWHYTIMHDLCNEGYLTEGHRLNFLKSHTNVVYQPAYSSEYYNGLNPYAVGFGIFQDVRRICENPTDEDKEYMPNLIGKDWLETVKSMTANYKDSSFIANFLSPKVVRDLKLFILDDQKDSEYYSVSHTHDKIDFIDLRRKLSINSEWDHHFPSMQVVSFDPTKPTANLVYKDFLHRDLPETVANLATKRNLAHLLGFNITLKRSNN